MSGNGREMEEMREILDRLLRAPGVSLDAEYDELRRKIPRLPDDGRPGSNQGIYAIRYENAEPGEFLLAGRTKTAAYGLWQRVKNHLGKTLPGLSVNRNRCLVQFVVIEDPNVRERAENFMLRRLRPRYCDAWAR